MLRLTLLILTFLVILSQTRLLYSFHEFVKNSVNELSDELRLLRINNKDFSIRGLWEIPLTLKSAEIALIDPFGACLKYSKHVCEILKTEELVDVVGIFKNILEVQAKLENVELATDPPIPEVIPRNIAACLNKLISYMMVAGTFLKKSYEDIPRDVRDKVYDFYRGEFQDIVKPSDKRRIFSMMSGFDMHSLIFALESVFKGLGEIDFDELKRINQFDTVRWETAIGDVILAGTQDDIYSPEDLDGVAILIDLGGVNHYEGCVAGAKEGEIKVVIDFGEKIFIKSTEPISVGSGVFGIGIMCLPDPDSYCEIETSDFSQGSGFCGAGIFFSNGRGIFKSGKYSQGAAIFGLGAFFNKASGSIYESEKYAQGFGGTLGVGIFKHTGDDSDLKAGFSEPDPRDEYGATSFCQGAGLGYREYAGGGVGICVIDGDNVKVESSYFAQGVGYWQSLGVLYLKGNNNMLKARRYSLGSGIHSATGMLFVDGNGNKIQNWGVGPAFGWDRGIGCAFVKGDENIIQTEWGAMNAQMRSRTLAYISGKGNKLKLPSVASAGFTGSIADYSIVVINGGQLDVCGLKESIKANETVYISPWGILKLDNCDLFDFDFVDVKWEKIPRESKINVERKTFEERIMSAKEHGVANMVRVLLSVASSFSIDRITPRKALLALAALDDSGIKYMYDELDHDNVSEIIHARVLNSIFGETGIDEVVQQIKNSSGKRKALFIHFLGFKKPSIAIPYLLKFIDDEDTRIKAACIRALYQVYNDRATDTIPKIELIKTLKRYLTEKKYKKQLVKKLTQAPIHEVLAVMSLSKKFSIDERLFIVENLPADITHHLDEKSAEKIISLFDNCDKSKCIDRLDRELMVIRDNRDIICKKIIEILTQATEEHIIWACLTLLGNTLAEKDYKLIFGYLNHSAGLVREAAIEAIGKIGAGWLIKELINSKDELESKNGLVTLFHGTKEKNLKFIKAGLKSKNLDIKKLSLSIVSSSKLFRERSVSQKVKMRALKDKTLRVQCLFTQ